MLTADYTFRLPMDRFQTVISPAVCQSLQSQGYVVIDNVFGPAWSDQLKQELKQLKGHGKMHLNSTHLIKQGGTELLEKQHVYEAELRDAVGDFAVLTIMDSTSATTKHTERFLHVAHCIQAHLLVSHTFPRLLWGSKVALTHACTP